MAGPTYDERRHFLSETAERRGIIRGKLDDAAARLARREALAGTVGTREESVLDRIEQLGFTGDSARVLDLLPLVHVAWADGRVQKAERAAILAIVEQRGIAPDSEASLLIESLLEARPSETFLAETLTLLRDLGGKAGGATKDIVGLCEKVAQASGGLLGLGKKTSDEERALIARIAEILGDAAVESFRDAYEKKPPP